MMARSTGFFHLSLPLLTGFAVMRLIVAPVALAQMHDSVWLQYCTGRSASLPTQTPSAPEDMTNSCPHMLRPRKAMLGG